MLSVRLLGGFEVSRDGEAVPLRSRNAQSLLAYLILRRGEHLRREKVSGDLWPDMPEDKARERLRYALWQLRKSLGEQYFEAGKLEVGMADGAELESDLEDLEAPIDPALSPDALAQHVGLYQGELLPGFYEEWILSRRRQAQTAFETKSYRLTQALAQTERWPEVLKWAEHWIAFGEVPEPAYRALIVAQAQVGDVAGAALAYQRCVDELREQLDVTPTDTTTELFERVRAGETPRHFDPGEALDLESETPAFLDPASGELTAEPTAFVAREALLDQLRRHLERAVDGSGQVVVVSGQAGSGKSSLLLQLALLAGEVDPQLRVARGQAEAHTGSGEPYLPFRDVLGQLTGDAEPGWRSGELPRTHAGRLWESAPDAIQAVLEHGPELIDTFLPGSSLLARAASHRQAGSQPLADLRGYLERHGRQAVPVNIDHGNVRDRLLEQYTRVIQQLSHHYPLLILLDDLQWADRGSLDLLFHLGRRIEGHSVLVVAAYRPEEVPTAGEHELNLPRLIGELRRTYGELELDLDQEGAQRGRELVDGIVDDQPNRLGESFRTQLHARTGGHPLFTVELLQQMRIDGSLRKDSDGRWVEGDRLNWDAVPARIEAVVENRLARLRTDLLELLQVASVEGETFTAEILASVTQRPQFAVVTALSRDLDRQHQLVEAVGATQVGDRRLSSYRFRHHLFQDHLYSSLDPVELAYLHEQVGTGLEQLYQRQSERVVVPLARHFELAGKIDSAAHYLVQAGKLAKGLSAHPETISHLTRALWLLRRHPDPDQRASLELEARVTLGAALVATQGYTSRQVVRSYTRARQLSERLGDTEQLAHALWGLWAYYVSLGDMRVTLDLAAQIQERAERQSDPLLRLVADWAFGITHTFRASHAEAAPHLKAAVEAVESGAFDKLRQVFGQDPEVTCRIYLAFVLAQLGELSDSARQAQRALEKADELGHQFSRAFVHAMAFVFHAVRGELEPATELAKSTLALSKEGGFPFLLGLGLSMRGWTIAASGKAQRGVELMRKGLETMQLTGAGIGRTFFLMLLAESLLRIGRPDDADPVIDEALGLGERHDEHIVEPELYLAKAKIELARAAEASQVEGLFKQAAQIAQAQGSKLMQLKTALAHHLQLGPTEQTRAALSAIFAQFEGEPEIPPLQEARELLSAD